MEEDLAEVFRRSARILSFAEDAEIVPVPLHSRKLRERGYNQAEFVGRALLLASGREPEVNNLLVRTVDTGTQTLLDRKSRLRNLKAAFSLSKREALDKEKRYLVVDDVFTTGATLNACAFALRRAGASEVDVLTLAHG